MTPETVPAVPGHALVADLIWRDPYYRTFSCTMYYTVAGGIVPTYIQLRDWASQLFANFGGEVDDIMDHDAYFNQVVATYVNNEGVGITAFSVGDPIPGVLGDIVEDPSDELESLPPECALVLRKITDKAGRVNAGRLFIPCISEQIQHDGIIDLLNYTGIRQVINALMEVTPLAGAACTPQHWCRPFTPSVDEPEGVARPSLFIPIKRMGATQFLRTRKDRQWKERPLIITET